jgi:hypothetical protein
VDFVGIDALPALDWYAEHHSEYTNVTSAAKQLHKELLESQQDWRQWSFRKYRLNRELQSDYCGSGGTCGW